MSGFYTYLWLRDDGSPYYAGKGCKARAFTAHQRGSNMRPPQDPAKIIIQEWPSEELAFEGEKMLIAYYGRIDQGTGCLRNLTDGGEGTRNVSEESRRKLSMALRGRIFSAEHRQKLSKSALGNTKFLGKKHTEDWCAKLSARMTGHKTSSVVRDKIRKRVSELWHDLSYRQHMSDVHKGKR